ncbi:MAG: alpha/beta hydrolase fold domain-containing protein [Planctomycetota bacterium]|nr:alpha/beta hydrolase fold domain-containing protein [Planctomycetota bacterium]
MKRLSWQPVLALLVGLLLPWGTVTGQPDNTRKRAKALFDRWDKNRDGKLARSELPESARRNFRRVDKNQDGTISLSEHTDYLTRSPATTPGKNKDLQGITIRRNIPYAETQNPRQMLDLILPRRRDSYRKLLPVVVWIHGGAWLGGSKANGVMQLGSFVSTGQFAGVSIGYRLSDEAKWPAQILDCKAAIRWIRGNAKKYHLDANNIAAYGTSAGGHLSAMLGVSGDNSQLEGKLGKYTHYPSRVTCVIDFFGPTAFLMMDDYPGNITHNAPDSPESRLIGKPIQQAPKLSRQASPVAHVSQDDAPHLIVHGTRDRLVPFQQSTLFHETLKQAGVPSTLITVREGQHGVRGQLLNKRITQFLQRHLYGKPNTLRDEVLDSKALQHKR